MPHAVKTHNVSRFLKLNSKQVAIFHDPADLPQASTTDNPLEHALEAFCPSCNHPVDATCPNCQSFVQPQGAVFDPEAERRALELLRRILRYVSSQRNSKFTIACTWVAFGFPEAGGTSMTVLARKFSVGKAAVSKVCREICEHFGIPPSRYMMTEESAQKFKLTNWKPTKTKR